MYSSHFTQMLIGIYNGDLECRDFCWDKRNQTFDFDNYNLKQYEEAIKKIAGILSWFPAHAGDQVDLAPAGIAFARCMENLGSLILLINDIEDLIAKEKHDADNDVGQKVSVIWGELMNLQLSTDDQLHSELAEDKETVRVSFNTLGKKRRHGVKLNEDELALVQKVVGIGRKYLPNIISALKPTLEQYNRAVRQSLAEVANLLPKNYAGQTDQRSEFYLKFVESYLDSLLAKIKIYKVISMESTYITTDGVVVQGLSRDVYPSRGAVIGERIRILDSSQLPRSATDIVLLTGKSVIVNHY